MTLTLMLALLQAPTGTPPDTTLAIRGILVAVPEDAAHAATWAVQLLQPISIGTLRTNVVELSGNPRRWMRYADRYVEARGRVTVRPGARRFAARLEAERVSETAPPGRVERRVRLSHSQHAVVTLAVVPNRIALPRPDTPPPEGARPVVLYTVTNIGTTDLEFYFPSSKAVCITVEPPGGRPWEDPTELRPGTGTTVVIRLGLIFRQLLPLPPEATRAPGPYVVRASLCGVIEYEVTATLEVIAP